MFTHFGGNQYIMGRLHNIDCIPFASFSSCSPTIGYSATYRGIGQYFEILFLAEFHLSCKMQLLIYEYKKKNSKIPSEN